MTPLPVSRIAFAVKLQQAGGLPVVVTHLASGKKNGDARQQEIEALVKWTQKLGVPQILMGDFNAKPSDLEIQPVLTMFRDAWQIALQAERRLATRARTGRTGSTTCSFGRRASS